MMEKLWYNNNMGQLHHEKEREGYPDREEPFRSLNAKLKSCKAEGSLGRKRRKKG